MKKIIRSNDFVLREIAGDAFLIPVGEASVKFNGMITLNGMSAFIWKELETGKTEEELVERVLEIYESTEAEVKADVQEFLAQLKKMDMVHEVE